MKPTSLPLRATGADGECVPRRAAVSCPVFFRVADDGDIVVRWHAPGGREQKHRLPADVFHARYKTRDEADAEQAAIEAAQRAADEARIASIQAARAEALRPLLGDAAAVMAWPPVETPNQARSRYVRHETRELARLMEPIEARLSRALYRLKTTTEAMAAAEEAVRQGRAWPLDFSEAEGDAIEDAAIAEIAALHARLAPGWKLLDGQAAKALARWERVAKRVIAIILPAYADDERLEHLAKKGERVDKLIEAARRRRGSPTKRDAALYDRLAAGIPPQDVFSTDDMAALDVYRKRRDDSFLRGWNSKLQGECCAEYVVKSTINMALHGRYEDGHLLQRWRPSGDSKTTLGNLSLRNAAIYADRAASRRKLRAAAKEAEAKADELVAAQIAAARPA